MRPNVLVIDDDLETLEIIKLYLTEIANVTTALGCVQAQQCVRDRQMDVILLDIEMPVMDGFKTLEQLRNLEECINVPVVMLTGKSDKLSVMNSVNLGVDGYLLKPVNKEALIGKVMEVCQRRNMPQRSRQTILAIDDDMTCLKQINSFLKDKYNVIMINSSKLALEYLTNHVPDLILLDYQMPLYNGVNLINIIRHNENCRELPFIILSGTLDQKAVRDFFPYSPAACLAKPINKDTLLQKINVTLSTSHPERYQ
jgi:response regulator RpfG family c-di-GMP phosphodiesterase